MAMQNAIIHNDCVYLKRKFSNETKKTRISDQNLSIKSTEILKIILVALSHPTSICFLSKMKFYDNELLLGLFFLLSIFSMTYCAPASDKETGLPSSPKKLSGDAQMLKEHPSLTRLSDGTEMYQVSRKDFGDGMTHIKLAPRPSSSNKIVHSPKQEEHHANRPSSPTSPGKSNLVKENPLLAQHGMMQVKLGQHPGSQTNAVDSSTKGAEPIRMVKYDPIKDRLVGHTRGPMTEQDRTEFQTSLSKAVKQAKELEERNSFGFSKS